jgi:hypothetical protein
MVRLGRVSVQAAGVGRLQDVGMATTFRVPNFLPSASGLKFANSWPHEADLALRLQGRLIFGIGDAANGLCGGMAFETADHHIAGVPIWSETEVPPPDSPHFKAIVRRQLDSLGWGLLPLRFYSLMAFRPETPTFLSNLLGHPSQATATVRDEWPRIRAGLDAGDLVNVGLVRASANDPRRLTSNHQVLAFGYTLDGTSLAIAIYDPNHPGDDTVELRVEIGPDGRVSKLEQSTGEPLFAFFQYAYEAKPPTD